MPLLSSLKARLAYRIFTTPLPVAAPPRFWPMLRQAKQYRQHHRTHRHVFSEPAKYIVHEHTVNDAIGRAIVVHGWMSKALYMTAHIKWLNELGYSVYALDLPRHGDAFYLFGNWRLYWQQTIGSILNAQARFGPFDIGLGHSYGAMMLPYSTVASSVSNEFSDNLTLQKLIMLAGPTSLNSIVNLFGNILRLNESEQKLFKARILKETPVEEIEDLEIATLRLHATDDLEIKCIHADNDRIVKYEDSQRLCEQLPYATLSEMNGLGHNGLLFNANVTNICRDFVAHS